MDDKIQKIINSSIQAAHLRGHRNSSMFGFLRMISKHLFSKEGVFVFCFFIKAFKTISCTVHPNYIGMYSTLFIIISSSIIIGYKLSGLNLLKSFFFLMNMLLCFG